MHFFRVNFFEKVSCLNCTTEAAAAIWLCHMALPYGSAIWLCHMALPYGFAIWLCHMALPYGSAIWHCHVALPYGSAIWHCHMALPYGSAIWPFHMALPYGIFIPTRCGAERLKIGSRVPSGPCGGLGAAAPNPIPRVLFCLSEKESKSTEFLYNEQKRNCHMYIYIYIYIFAHIYLPL